MTSALIKSILEKSDGRAGRDGDGDGILNEEEKRRGGVNSAHVAAGIAAGAAAIGGAYMAAKRGTFGGAASNAVRGFENNVRAGYDLAQHGSSVAASPAGGSAKIGYAAGKAREFAGNSANLLNNKIGTAYKKTSEYASGVNAGLRGAESKAINSFDTKATKDRFARQNAGHAFGYKVRSGAVNTYNKVNSNIKSASERAKGSLIGRLLQRSNNQ